MNHPHVTMWMGPVTASLDILGQHVTKVCASNYNIISYACISHAECPGGFFGQDCLDVCQCENGDCDFISGFCNCSIGYAGVACNMSTLLAP